MLQEQPDLFLLEVHLYYECLLLLLIYLKSVELLLFVMTHTCFPAQSELGEKTTCLVDLKVSPPT